MRALTSTAPDRMGIGQKLPGVLLDSGATYLLDRHMFAWWTCSGHHRAVGVVPPHGDTQSVALLFPTSESGGFEVSDVDCALIEPDKLAGALLDSPGKSVDAWRGLRIADCGLRIADCGLRIAGGDAALPIAGHGRAASLGSRGVRRRASRPIDRCRSSGGGSPLRGGPHACRYAGAGWPRPCPPPTTAWPPSCGCACASRPTASHPPERGRDCLDCLLCTLLLLARPLDVRAGRSGSCDDVAMNRLADEQSPYLLQHASNPVDWWPWGEEAMTEAKRRDVPILLSVGYASCHL
ncbi:uncharacterized protein DUF255 [Streptomyces sp. 2333.5]|nr:uncharacterized protein DUF255 [Streptomyces sp. 2333.5]SEE67704.1 Protein of unknown function, DUF255 [Streptomyces sp. 2112.2]